MNPQYHTDELIRMYDLRRTNNVHERKRRLEEIYTNIPEYKELDASLPDIALKNVQAILRGQNISQNNSSELTIIDNKKRKLLTDNGYPADYLDPVYTCPDCKDTGYIGTARCHCYKEAFMNIICKEYKINKVSFSDFNINYYPDDYIDETNDTTPRDNIKKVLKTCKEYIESFNKHADNLLIYGHSGVGKTFLTHCIAKELLDKGYSVIYLTSYELFAILETKVFRSDEMDYLSESVLSMLYTSDLLIIDDLGTERINKFTETQLYECIQERLRNEHSTIVSTNLSFEDIKNNYSERILSRLLGYYKLIKILGRDRRIKKALEENGGKK